MDQLFLFTPLTCLDPPAYSQSFPPHLGASPQTPGVYRMKPRGLMAARFGPRESITPTRGPEAKAPLAKPAAPVALQQSRILRATLDDRFQSADDQSIATSARTNPVLFRPRQNEKADEAIRNRVRGMGRLVSVDGYQVSDIGVLANIRVMKPVLASVPGSAF
jgi:hypothetical protein